MPRMTPPESGVKVRMYRQGHGDCFLLAMRSVDDEPFYMLIDCGLKPKSEIKPSLTIDKIIADIDEATGGKLDVVLVTHESDIALYAKRIVELHDGRVISDGGVTGRRNASLDLDSLRSGTGSASDGKSPGRNDAA